MDLSGWVFVGLTLIVLGYLVPHMTRRQRVAAESRAADRFSPKLRLVEPESRPATAEHRAEARVTLHPPEIARRRTEALAMIRPTAPDANRMNARELASQRAHRAAAISRRAAAGRRRAVLSGITIVIATFTWTLVSAGTIALAWAIAPSLLALGMIYLATRAAWADRTADSRARAEIARLDARLRLFRSEAAATAAAAPASAETFAEILSPRVGAHSEGAADLDEAAPPKHARTAENSVFMEFDESAGSDRPRRAADESLPLEGGPEWTPVPVPVPTYTLKAEVPRREASLFEMEEAPRAIGPVRPSGAAPSRASDEDDAQAFVLADVLARRRVAGA